MSDDRPGLLRDPEFLKFWGGQSISLLGTQFTLLALPITAAVTLRATPAEMGLLTALQFAPGLLFSLAAGVWLDRSRRRPVLVTTQVASALVLASVPLVGRERLVEANARYQTSWTFASLIGPGLAGAAVQLLTAPLAIAVDASSFVVGALSAAWLRVTEPVVERSPRRHGVREAAEGLAQLWRQPLVRGITGTLLIANAGGGMAAAVTVLLFVRQIGLPPAQFGLVFVAASLSSLAGSVLVRPLQRRTGLGPVMVLATVFVAAGTIVRAGAGFTAQPVTFPLLVAGSLVSGFGLMTYNVPQQAIRQAVIPDRMLGRTSAGVTLAVYAGSVAASLAGGLLGQVAGLRWTLVVATAITAACVLPTALGPLRALRDVPGADRSVIPPRVDDQRHSAPG